MGHRLAVQALVVVGLGLLGLGGLVQSPQAEEAQVSVGFTGPNELVMDSPSKMIGMSWPRYQAEVKPYSSRTTLIPLREPLTEAEAAVQYGLNAVFPLGRSDHFLGADHPG